MEWQNNKNSYYQRPESPIARFLRYLLYGIFLGSALLFIIEWLWFNQAYAYYELAKVMCCLDDGDYLNNWQAFWLPIKGQPAHPKQIIEYVESDFRFWYCLRLFLCHIIGLVVVFWSGYRLSTLSTLRRPVEMGDRGTEIVSAAQLGKRLHLGE